jgi:hypothetical protein
LSFVFVLLPVRAQPDQDALTALAPASSPAYGGLSLTRPSSIGTVRIAIDIFPRVGCVATQFDTDTDSDTDTIPIPIGLKSYS